MEAHFRIPFTVYTDHIPLENFSDEELGDLTAYLSQFNFNIKYNPGVINTESDCLSRNPVDSQLSDTQDALKITNTRSDNKVSGLRFENREKGVQKK